MTPFFQFFWKDVNIRGWYRLVTQNMGVEMDDPKMSRVWRRKTQKMGRVEMKESKNRTWMCKAEGPSLRVFLAHYFSK